MPTARRAATIIPSPRCRALALCVFALVGVAPIVAGGPPAAKSNPHADFDAVAPILISRCLECHGSAAGEGGLDLSTRAGMLKGGENGPAAVPGDAEKSRLLARIRASEMPPEKEGVEPKLPDREQQVLADWIAAGARWPSDRTLSLNEKSSKTRAGLDWWSLQPVKRPPIPQPRQSERLANPVDAFLLAKLEASSMTFAPRADRRTLIRRLSFDLTGLPPTFDEVQAFVHDDSDKAYERLVDRLLDSPRFGERWARYWLDLVRFAETCGYERDQEKPAAWRYRDYVVAAINNDKPYDRFVLEQLAGDELGDRNEETVIATGFLRLGTWNDEPNDPQEYKYERIEDLVHTTSTAFLGLTVKCARCHDHKFDPIPQTDYYRLAAVFWAGHVEPRGADLLGGPSKDELGYENVLGYTDRSRDPPPLHLLRKGDPHRPEHVVAPGYLSLARELDRPLPGPPKEAKTSQRRLQWARWIVDPRNPLAARVAVNRLWQHHFGAGLVRTPDNFGFTGRPPTHPDLLDWLAAELVEGGWRMKRLHKLLVLSEAYRQASSRPDDKAYRSRDADNSQWWRAGRRRLDAESIRDAMLSVSGRLDLTMGGPSFRPSIAPDALEGLSMKGSAWKSSPPEAQRRRSLYMFSKRSLLSPLMTTFDFCDTSQPCAQRDVTTVAPQALALLNNEFVHETSAAIASRIERDSGDLEKQPVLAWRMILGRSPTDAERAAAAEHLATQRTLVRAVTNEKAAKASNAERQAIAERAALTSLCHVLLNSNEFLYVD